MYDAIIIGSGTVGLTMANLLATLGLKICIIEKGNSIHKISNAVGVNDECLFAWKICGILEKISPYIGYNDNGEIILKYLDENKKEIFSLRQKQGMEGLPNGVVFLQNKIDEALFENLQGKVEINFGEELVEIIHNQENVAIKTTKQTYQSKYLIAADGKEGATRKLLNINLKKLSESKNEWLVLNLLVKNRTLNKKYVEVFCGERSVVSCPLPCDYHRAEISLLKGEENILNDEKKIREILAKYVDFNDYEIINKAKFRFLTAIVERYHQNRIVLCGDAAHSTAPFASAGLMCGIRDCMALYNIFKSKNIDFYLYQSLRFKRQMKSLRLAMTMEKIMLPNKFFAKILFASIRFMSHFNLLIKKFSIRS